MQKVNKLLSDALVEKKDLQYNGKKDRWRTLVHKTLNRKLKILQQEIIFFLEYKKLNVLFNSQYI